LPPQRESLPVASQPLLGRSPSEPTEAHAQNDAPDAEASGAEVGVAESGLEKPGLALEESESSIGKRWRSKIPNGVNVGSDL
jgi:hypothetical protein